MFKFNGTLSELRTYLDSVFTKSAQKTLDLFVYALKQTVQARGNYRDVRDMLGHVFTQKHLESLQLEVDIHQPGVGLKRTSEGRVLPQLFDQWPSDLCLGDVHATLRNGGGVITAIKAYRQITGEGLAESKQYVDKWRHENGIPIP